MDKLTPEKFYQILLSGKEQILQFHASNFQARSALYYTYKYYTGSLHVFRLTTVVQEGVDILARINPEYKVNRSLLKLQQQVVPLSFQLLYNERWEEEPFKVFSVYLHLKEIYNYLVTMLSKEKLSDKEIKEIDYWMRYTLYGSKKTNN